MKKIIYRTENIYKEGIFISSQTIVYILIALSLIIFIKIANTDLNFWVKIFIFLILGGIISYYSEISDFRFININYDSSNYVNKLLKSKKKYYEIKKNLIGTYEIESLTSYSNSLIEFYKNCIEEIKLQSKDEKTTNKHLLESIVLDFEDKIHLLASVNNYYVSKQKNNDTKFDTEQKRELIETFDSLIEHFDNYLIIAKKQGGTRGHMVGSIRSKLIDILEFVKLKF